MKRNKCVNYVVCIIHVLLWILNFKHKDAINTYLSLEIMLKCEHDKSQQANMLSSQLDK